MTEPTPEDVAGAAAGAAAFGAAIATAWARIRATKRLERRDVMTALQDIARSQAEQAAASHEQHQECRREVDALRGQQQEQSVRIATAEGHYAAARMEHAQCPERIAVLEREVDRLSRRSTPPGGSPSLAALET